jgi:SAM-dependent methyltransferase
MESEEESIRLDLKTDPKTIKKQAIWAGLKPGMRVADLGCGPGKTTFFLNKLVQPNVLLGDIRNPLDNLGLFDFIWIRFVLEHYCSTSFDIVKNISSLLKPGGIICLIDLDYNCLRHFGLSDRLNIAICEIMKNLEKKADFDPYVGIKLYSFLFDLGYQDIDVSLDAHHLIFGELKETDEFNWRKKVEIAGKNSGYKFEEYERGYEEFFEEFKQFFSDPRRFTYTPIISCRGCKPVN